ncbi:ADP-ribosylation factor-like protein 2 isoform X2 [Chamaea fasciata]|uniref:ADP-ribosylation factor-like protein 2 isoform X2 n=1 Tax=Chamaea fasciata TaxID=190680 RepID=UPI00336ADBD1
MGLLTILKKMREKERELRLLVLGLDNAGKTTLLKRLNGEDVGGTSPTLGFNIKTLEHRGFQLHVWDVGGQSSLRSYWRNYFESTDGLVWVVDSSDRQRLRLCATELKALLREEALELDSIRSHRWRLQGCSAFTGRDLLPGLDWLLDDIGARLCPPD